MEITENIIKHIDNEFEFIDNLEKKYDISAKKVFNEDKSNRELLLYELFQFLLAIIEYKPTTESQCVIFSAIAKEKMSTQEIDTLKQNINHDISFCSLQLFIIFDLKSNTKYYNGVSHKLFKLFKTLGNILISTTTNKTKAAETMEYYLEKMAGIIVDYFKTTLD